MDEKNNNKVVRLKGVTFVKMSDEYWKRDGHKWSLGVER